MGDVRLTQDDVLVLIADGATGPYELDPLRLMKAAFLVSQRGRPEWQELFKFRAYNYGPFDPSVYGARDRLIAQGLLQKNSERRYETYALTDAGRERAQELAEAVGDENAEWFRSIGAYVTNHSFATLLRQIYTAFPRFAARSIARV
jgi:uncharacterized protein